MATLNPGIILAGRQPQPLNALAQGTQLAAATGQVQDANTLRDLYQQQGPGIMQGDPQALNALAQVDPGAALGIQNTRAQMDERQERLRLAREQAAFAVQQAAANMSAEEVAREQQQMQTALERAAALAQRGNVEMAARVLSEAAGQDVPADPEAIDTAILMLDGGLQALATAQKVFPAEEGPTSTIITGERAEIMGLDPSLAYNYNTKTGEAKPIGGARTEVTVNNNAAPDQGALYDTLDKRQGEMFASLLEQGATVPQNMAQLDELERILGQQDTPAGMEAALKSFAGDLGVPSDGLDGLQAANAIISRLVPQQRPPGSGPMSDADLALFKQSLPRLINTREGNMMILRTLRGIQKYQLMQADIASRLANREITPNQARQALQSLENPLSEFRREGATTIGGFEIDAETQSVIDRYAD